MEQPEREFGLDEEIPLKAKDGGWPRPSEARVIRMHHVHPSPSCLLLLSPAHTDEAIKKPAQSTPHVHLSSSTFIAVVRFRIRILPANCTLAGSYFTTSNVGWMPSRH